MLYNIAIESPRIGKKNILGINKIELERLISAYQQGKSSVTINGEKVFIEYLELVKIFDVSRAKNEYFSASKMVTDLQNWSNTFNNKEINLATLREFGEDVTSKYINGGWGEGQELHPNKKFFPQGSFQTDLKTGIQDNFEMVESPNVNSSITEGKRYWAGGFGRGDEFYERLEDFKKNNYWQALDYDEDSNQAVAENAWRLFKQIKVGDQFIIKGYGGNHSLTVHYIGEVIKKNGEDGRLDFKKLEIQHYKGDAPRGEGAGNWFNTLLEIYRPEDINLLFTTGGQKKVSLEPTKEENFSDFWLLCYDSRSWPVEFKIGDNFWFHKNDIDGRPINIEKNFREIKRNDLIFPFSIVKEKPNKWFFSLTKELHFSQELNGDVIEFKPLFNINKEVRYAEIVNFNAFSEGEVGKSKFEIGLYKLNNEEIDELMKLCEINVDTLKIGNIQPNEISNNLSYVDVSNDQVSGTKDLLGFEKDIRSFASIMSLKAIKPPLAIALFGNWGSGKSFFMNGLQQDIAYLSKHQCFKGTYSKNSDNKIFCEGVLQIQFNAWSYLDANLWAGLVANIFEKIDEYISEQTKGETEKQKVREILNEKLEVVVSNKKKILETRDELIHNKVRIKSELEKLEKDQKELIQNVANKKLDTIVQEVRKKIDLDPIVKGQLEQYGITRDRLYEISPDTLYTELFSWITFVKSFLRLSKKSIVIILIAALVLLLLWINPDGITEKLHLVGVKGILTFFGIVGPVFMNFYDSYSQFKKLIQPVTKFKDDFNREMEEAKFNYTVQANLLKSKIEQTSNDIEEKIIELEKTEENIEEVEYELKYSVTKRAFYNFIKNKAKDEKYEKHLGIISTIRRDFETLSELFLDHSSEQNDTDEEKKKNNEKQREYELFKNQFNKPLDRIILYIDDLDRCSEDKVLEVLQAVHLLMAFPLFIVVVGVDKRCVNNALNYKNLIQYKHLTNSNTAKELMNHGIQVIQPNEYLEKIFQIPFHIQETSSEGIKMMIDKLLTGQVEWEDLEIKNGDITLESLIQEVPKATNQDWQEAFLGSENKIKTEERKNDVILVENLTITGIELTYLKEISWLVDNTPRTAKRFINLYRIVRAHESLTYTKEDRNEEFMIIMFLLGVSNGPFHSLSQELAKQFKEANEYNYSADFDYTLDNFFKKPPSSSFLKTEKEIMYQKLKSNLDLCPNFKQILNSHPSKFYKYLSFIQRFSFS
ncbi:MAG: P-loop NTPase fold protein [Bacteroidota bacterium]